MTARILIEFQKKGVEELNALHHAKQAAFCRQLGIDDLMTIPQDRR